MSWSVSTRGKVAEVKAELERQFAQPLADAHAGLTDEGERETVQRVRDTISQCLDTFGPEKEVMVTANGHMGFSDWETKEGAYQEVSVSIRPCA
ncbi:MAG: hypothetical protein LAQ69_22510 [Acidobacteriia bacterium]|nr:hypothetical protein [Terriglobia bacterium]